MRSAAKWERIANDLRGDILLFGPAYDIPSENMLMKIYKVSRATARRALSALSYEGLIEVMPGRGRRVKIGDNGPPTSVSVEWLMTECRGCGHSRGAHQDAGTGRCILFEYELCPCEKMEDPGAE